MTQHQRGRRGLIALLLALTASIAVLDQVTKYLAEARLTHGVLVPVLGDFLGLQLIYNPGAAFSFATGMTWVFTLITIVVVVVVLRVSRRLRSTVWAVALGLLLGGALGNLYDRLLREPGFARGHVVDFINYNGWFVGNVADIAIVLAAVLIAVLALFGIEVDGTRVTSGRDAEDEAPQQPDGADDELSEEPVVDDQDFSPEVPRATGDGVDLATWVAGATSASEARPQPAAAGPPKDAAEPVPADLPSDTAEPATGNAGPATGTAEPPADTAGPASDTSGSATDTAEPPADTTGPTAAAAEPSAPARRPRTRREARLAGDADDG